MSTETEADIYPDYPDEIKALELEIHSTRSAIWNAHMAGRTVPKKCADELRRLEKRLDKMKQLFWIVTLNEWIKNL